MNYFLFFVIICLTLRIDFITCDLSAICQVLTKDKVWQFSQWDRTPLMTVANVTDYNENWSFVLQFCGRVDGIIGNITDVPSDDWLGWSFGILENFSFTGNGTIYSFRQMYMYGDKGYACLTGRIAQVDISCGICPIGMNCLSGTPDYCLCGVEYSPLKDPCQVNIQMSLSCPDPVTPSPNPVNPKPTEGTYAAFIIAIIFSILLMILILGCVGGYAYNVRVQNKSGLDAIPGIDICRRRETDLPGDYSDPKVEEKQPIITEKNYGTM